MSAGAEVLQEIQDLWESIKSKYETLRNTVNSVLDKVPGFLDWIVDRVKEGWAKLTGAIDKVVDRFTYMASHMGDPGALSASADNWSTNVGTKSSNEVTSVDAGMLLVDDNWEGDAASQYKQHIPLQKAALQAIKTTFTDTIGTALDKVQTAIVVFWVALAGGLAALIAGFIGAITSAATIFGLPAAPFIAAAAALVFDACMIGGVLNLEAQCRGANTMLVAKLSDNTAFPDGAWPKGTA